MCHAVTIWHSVSSTNWLMSPICILLASDTSPGSSMGGISLDGIAQQPDQIEQMERGGQLVLNQFVLDGQQNLLLPLGALKIVVGMAGSRILQAVSPSRCCGPASM